MVNICVPRLQVLNVHTPIISLFVFLSPEVWTYSETTGRLGDVKRCSCNFTLSRPWGIITLLDAWTLLRPTQFYTCTTTSNSPTLVYVLLLSPQLLWHILGEASLYDLQLWHHNFLLILFWLVLDEFSVGKGTVSAAGRLLTPFDFLQEVCWVSFVSMFDWLLPWQAWATLKICLTYKGCNCESVALLFSLFVKGQSTTPYLTKG